MNNQFNSKDSPGGLLEGGDVFAWSYRMNKNIQIKIEINKDKNKSIPVRKQLIENEKQCDVLKE